MGLFLQSLIEIGPVIMAHRQTDRQTDRRTYTQTVTQTSRIFSDPYDPKYSVNENDRI